MIELGDVVGVIHTFPDHRCRRHVGGLADAAVMAGPQHAGVVRVEKGHVLVWMLVLVLADVIYRSVAAYPHLILVAVGGRKPVSRTVQIGSSNQDEILVIRFHGHDHVVVALGIHLSHRVPEIRNVVGSIGERRVRYGGDFK